MFKASSLCIIGVILIVVGIWLYATIYWDNRNAPGFQEKLKNLEEKERNKEALSFGDYLNLRSQSIMKSISKVSIVAGLIVVAIGCILKSVY